MTDLIKLAERVEALDGPDREVDIAIAEAVGIRLWYAQGDPEFHYTASLVAAVSLMPEGMDWSAHSYGAAHVWKSDTDISEYGVAKTIVLALTAAALRARSKT